MADSATATATETATPVRNTSLYVGDLHPGVDESKLHDVFAAIGDVSSVRICRDTLTGLSLCYGYVNFIKHEDASIAIEKLNNTPLNGRLIRVMWSERNAEARKSGIGNVFVKNLQESIDNVKLYDMFSKYGRISSCKVAMGLDGKSKGYGFVQFETEESAKTAIENVNGSSFHGKEIYVAHFVKKSERVSSSDPKLTNLYIKNLDKELTEEFLMEKFSEFGKITKLVILKNSYGMSNGVGFINFETSDNAKQAMEAMNGSQLGSKTVYVAWAQKKEDRKQMLHRQFGEKRNEEMKKYEGLNVYIKNINDDVSDDELRELFNQCGTIRSSKIMRDDKGTSKGFGFVCFSTPEEARAAVNGLHGYIFHRKPLYVALAEKKGERQAKWQLQYAQKVVALNSTATAVMPTGYSPAVFYTTSPGVLSQFSSPQSLMFQRQPLGPRQEWYEPDGLLAGPRAVPFLQSLQQSARVRPSNQQAGRNNNMGNGLQHEMNNTKFAAASSSHGGLKTLSRMLALASPQQQKEILGQRLYPLVKKLKNQLAAKITGMLLELDNSELLLLIGSPDTLAAKVEEAARVLQLTKSKLPGHDSYHPNNVSTGTRVVVK